MKMAQFCSDCGKPTEANAKFCTHCGASFTETPAGKLHLQEKRAKVLGNQDTGKRKSYKTFFLALLIAALAGWVYINLPEGGNPIIKALPVVLSPASYSDAGQQMIDVPSKVENGKIIIPLELLKERKFLAFNYTKTSVPVPLLAYISGEGKVVTAVSMCEPCNSNRFHIKTDKLVCNTCGSTWELDNLEALGGSCGRYPPDAVPNTVVGNEIQIDEELVARWQRRI